MKNLSMAEAEKGGLTTRVIDLEGQLVEAVL